MRQGLITLPILCAMAYALPLNQPEGTAELQTRQTMPWSWKPGVPWQIVLHNPIDITHPLEPSPDVVKVWIIDLFMADDNPEMIPWLKSQSDDLVVICYLNIGAIDNGDRDYNYFPESAKGNDYFGYPREKWINVRDKEVMAFMKDRIDLAAKLGCHGLDPDNMDGYVNEWQPEDKTGFSLTEDDLVVYTSALADYAHDRGLLFGQKNAPDLSERLVEFCDFAILESCLGTVANPEWAFCDQFRNYIDDAGKPVFDIEYPLSVLKPSATWMTRKDFKFFCEMKNGDAGFSKIIKHASALLDGWGQYCSSFTTALGEEDE